MQIKNINTFQADNTAFRAKWLVTSMQNEVLLRSAEENFKMRNGNSFFDAMKNILKISPKDELTISKWTDDNKFLYLNVKNLSKNTSYNRCLNILEEYSTPQFIAQKVFSTIEAIYSKKNLRLQIFGENPEIQDVKSVRYKPSFTARDFMINNIYPHFISDIKGY